MNNTIRHPATVSRTDPAVTARSEAAARPSSSCHWKGAALTALAGIGGIFLLNRLLPPASLTRALGRYALSLAPAALYLGSVACRALADAPPLRFTIASPEEKARRQRLGIPEDAMLCTIYTAAWLRHPDSLVFSDAELLQEYRREQHTEHSLLAQMRAAWLNGWRARPLPGCGQLSTDQLQATTTQALRPDDLRFSFPIKCFGIDDGLCLDQLDVGEVMLVILTPHRELQQQRQPHVVAVYRADCDHFTYFNASGTLRMGDSSVRVDARYPGNMIRTAYAQFDVYALIRLGKDQDGRELLAPVTSPDSR